MAPLATALTILPANIVVLVSATPQESVDLATLSYHLTNSHVIHIFDQYSSSREMGHIITPPLPAPENAGLTVPEIIKQSGYSSFDFVGDKEAETVVVVLNGPLALAAKAVAARVIGLGVVVVRVLRPWDEPALRKILPSKVKNLHVFDDVPNEATEVPSR